MKRNPSDPVFDEIREVRQPISSRFGHDPARLVAFLVGIQRSTVPENMNPPGFRITLSKAVLLFRSEADRRFGAG